ncbi:hypothetical protein D8B46_06860 [Candidatus Gracilibacteria bacterium]|nr:MAG: hypothetical protein D8B46_06860 [Candidatus Gracilibacteria bacterium]
MLPFIAKIFYIGNLIGILSLVLIFLIFGSDFQIVNREILSLSFAVLVLPVFDKIFEYIKSDSVFNFELSKENIVKLIAIPVLLLVIFLAQETSILSILTLGILFFGILFAVDERNYFLGSLCLLIIIIFEVLIENTGNADYLSIYMYYLLIIGVLISILNNSVNKDLIKSQEKNIFLNKIKNIKKAENLVYGGFIAYILAFTACILIGSYSLIKYFFGAFIVVYIVGKILGFKLTFTINKQELKDINLGNWYIISTILSIMTLKFLLNGDNTIMIFFLAIVFIVNIICYILI